MNKYIVSVPLTGAIHVEVEAASAKEANVRKCVFLPRKRRVLRW